MTKLFITGICGFIGRNVAKRALELGYVVSGADIKLIKIPGVKVTKADIRNKKAMLKLTKNVDYVIHLAAVTSNLEFEKNMPYAYDVNVNGFNNVIEAAYRNRCKKFIYASSSAVYSNEFSEDTVIDIGRMRNHYAKTKLMNEAVGKSYRLNNILDAIGLRFFNVYGNGENEKGNYASIINIFRKYKKAGKRIVIYGNGKQARDFVYVRDVAEIVLLILNKGKKDLYNIGTGKTVSYNEIAEMIDTKKKKHVKNPLSTYQHLTKADTKRLLYAIGYYKFVDVRDGILKFAEDNN